MKKLITCLLFLAGTTWANGPLYGPSYNAQRTNLEFQNAYSDIQHPFISTGTAQNMTIVNESATRLAVSLKLTVPNGSVSTDAAAFGQIHIFQIVAANDGTSTSSTAAGYAATNLTGSITPSDASHKVLVLVTGALNNSSISGANVGAAVFRGTTQVTTGDSCLLGEGGSAIAITTPCSMAVSDSPAATTSTAYTVKIRIEAGSGTVVWNRATQTTTMILVEYL